MPTHPDCRYCTATLAQLDSVLHHVTDLVHSRIFLYQDQTHRGRCVVLLKRHARELFELETAELAGFMREVADVAAAVAQSVPCEKLNYAMYGDEADHLHVHVVPKTRGGPAWGQPFILNAEAPRRLSPPDLLALAARLKRQLLAG